ncbi:MAG: hypothetical protein J0L52_08745 [Caulobacterales bacterium]|nr:hypothetical protein [Caulobacterales bacterium]
MKPVLFGTALLLLTACDPAAAQRAAAVDRADSQAEAARQVPVLMAAGDPIPVDADVGDALQWSASVVRVDQLENQGLQSSIKMFGAAGGDPAMNGLYTYIAFFAGVTDGWRVFQIGDFLEYRILSDAPGRLDLEVLESVLNPANDEISSRTRRLIVTWTPQGPDGAPTSISVAEAR